jgi:hypothetical protein
VHAFDIGVGGFFLACVVIILSWLFTDRIGRRRLWLIGVGGNVLGMATVGGLAYVKGNSGLWAIAVVMLDHPYASSHLDRRADYLKEPPHTLANLHLYRHGMDNNPRNRIVSPSSTHPIHRFPSASRI